MNLLLVIGLVAGVFSGAWWTTGWFRRYALAHGVLDIPNERSSHVEATPRGGGTAIVISMLAGLPVAAACHLLPWTSVWALGVGGLLVAGIGFVDDHRHLHPRWRLLGHAAAAIWLLVWIQGLPPLPVFGVTVSFGWLGHGLAAIYVVWLINLTNFMDGIDGIAATEAATVAVSGALLAALTVPGTPSWIEAILLAASAGGFLVWNWPPAKIFMGDAGSGFLGLMFGALSLEAGWIDPALFWSWVILLGVFVVDATVTVLRRAVARAPLHVAHRTHAYQHAATRWRAHKPVTVATAAITLLWLLPIAALVATQRLDGLTGVLVAHTPLTAAAVWLGAGRSAAAAREGGRVERTYNTNRLP